MHRPRLPYEERESTSTKWVIVFVLLSIVAHILTFFGLYFCAKHLPGPKLPNPPQETPEVSLSYMAPPPPLVPKPKPQAQQHIFMPTTPDAEAKDQNTPIESDNTTRVKSENKNVRKPDSVMPDITGKDHHTMDMQDSPLVQSKPTPPAAASPPTPKAEAPQKPTPPQPPKPDEAKAQQPPPPDQTKAPIAPKPNPAPPRPPTPQVVKKTPPPPQVDPDTGLPVLPTINAPTMAPQTPNTPNQQQRTASAEPPPSFELNKSDNSGGGVNGPNSVSANATPLGKYKAKLYRAVGSRWYTKVGAQSDLMPVGMVRVQYTVYSDGSVTTKVLDGGNSTLQILLSVSVNSIREAAPFDPFSDALIKQVGTSFTDEFNFSVY